MYGDSPNSTSLMLLQCWLTFRGERQGEQQERIGSSAQVYYHYLSPRLGDGIHVICMDLRRDVGRFDRSQRSRNQKQLCRVLLHHARCVRRCMGLPNIPSLDRQITGRARKGTSSSKSSSAISPRSGGVSSSSVGAGTTARIETHSVCARRRDSTEAIDSGATSVCRCQFENGRPRVSAGSFQSLLGSDRRGHNASWRDR